MAAIFSAEGFRFLFRQDRGTIDRTTWALGTLVIVVAWLLLYLADRLVDRASDIAKVGLIGLFVMVTMLLAACYYFVSAKRFRERGRPPSLALVLPAAGLATTALHFLQPPTGGTFPLWLATVADVVLAAIAVWNVVELGFLAGRPSGRGRADG